MEIFKETYGEIRFNDSVPCVEWVPLEYMKGEEFRKLMSAGVEFYADKKNGLPNLLWLNDASKMKVVNKEEQNWLAEVVNNQAKKNGLTHMAFVLPENIFGKIAVKIYVEGTLKKADNNMFIKTFYSRDKAIAWLQQKAEQFVTA